MGRDEHKSKKKKNGLHQTPKNQKSDGIDVEFSSELADQADMTAIERSKKTKKRNKK